MLFLACSASTFVGQRENARVLQGVTRANRPSPSNGAVKTEGWSIKRALVIALCGCHAFAQVKTDEANPGFGG